MMVVEPSLRLSSKNDSKRRSRLQRILIWICIFSTLGYSSCSDNPVAIEGPLELFVNAPVEMGIPTDADNSDDLIIRHFQYTVSYNPNLNVANWVSWNEDSVWYGPSERCDCFNNDPQLPAGVNKISDSFYTGSGYDRSHILGSEARTRSDSDNKATFYFTNIMPQTPTLNRQTWYSLEKYCDSLCTKANKELYIVAGGVYVNKNRLKNVITIPDSCWKVVLVMERGQRLRHVRSETEVIAVMMNNGTYTKDNNEWRQYRTTVRAIEKTTGYNLLDAIPKGIQDVIETKQW